MEENVQVKGDEGFKKAKEYDVRRIETPYLYSSEQRETPIDIGDPERKSPFFDQCTKEIAERIPIIHQITGEDIVRDDCPLHECKLIERKDGKEEEDQYHPPFVSI
jgi:hypothetical protein